MVPPDLEAEVYHEVRVLLVAVIVPALDLALAVHPILHLHMVHLVEEEVTTTDLPQPAGTTIMVPTGPHQEGLIRRVPIRLL